VSYDIFLEDTGLAVSVPVIGIGHLLVKLLFTSKGKKLSGTSVRVLGPTLIMSTSHLG